MITSTRAGTSRICGVLAMGVAGALVGGLLVAAPAAAATPRWSALKPAQTKSVAGHSVPVRKPAAADAVAAAARRVSPQPVWPAAGSATVTVGATAPGAVAGAKLPAATRAGNLPVWVGMAQARSTTEIKAASGSELSGTSPGQVRVDVLSRAAAETVGVHGLVLAVSSAEAHTNRVALHVGYGSFEGAFGGDWASRLRLVRLPDCALTTPTVAACQVGSPVVGTNDFRTKTVIADVDVPAGSPQGATASGDGRGAEVARPAVFAMAAAASGPSGAYSATPLSASAAWQVGEQTGDFTWSYPLRVPPAVNGPTPALGVSYSSGSVDGRTASTNNQPSWVGEGQSMESGYVERKYVSCADDQAGGNNTTKTGDLCWRSDNATVVLGGHSSELVKDAATGVWRLKNDDASRMERLSGGSNADNDTEYWRLTTTDGTQYHFGLGKRYAADTVNTNSTWTVPVFGNQAGEPCNHATFAASYCTQAWRWNLDYVVDPHGNTMTYFYTPETNNYARNLTGMSTYTRGGYLARIEYGERRGSEATTTAPSQVLFTVSERCVPSGTITCAPAQLNAGNAPYWPDVPFDQICTTSTCPNRTSPTFFTRKRLTSVTTQALTGGAYANVDSWAFAQTFPATGDGTSKGLWLLSLTHSGLVGGTATLAPVTFGGTQLANRVDGLDNAPPLIKWRVSSITSETGSRISPTYSAPECTPASLPSSPQFDYKRCFPVFWAAYGVAAPTLNYFHKYVVTSVAQSDFTGGGLDQQTSYVYVGAPAWHHDDSELVEPKLRTYGDYRGYTFVKVLTGTAGQVQQTLSQSLFMRGMHGDKLPDGTTRNVFVTDSEGGTLTDSDRLAGYTREQIVYNGNGGPQVSGTINDPWISAATATSGVNKAYLLQTAKVRDRTVLAAGGFRRTEVDTTFDGYGMPSMVDDRGDVAAASDDLCSRISYARNTTAWNLTGQARAETVSVACAASPARPADVVSDVRMYYDGSTTVGAAPVRGDLTKAETLTSWSGGPVYATKSRSEYDVHGRMTAVYDGLDRKTSTAFTPAVGGPVSQTVTTNALGHASTSTLNAAWGSPTAEVDANGKRTDLTYDPMGRLTAVWLPGRSKSAGVSANMKFDYLIRTSGPNAVGTSELRNDGSYTTSYALFDGLLRPRETQTPAEGGGGRILNETVYDSRGLAVDSNGPFYDSSAPSTSLFTASTDVQLPTQNRTTYDGAGRPVVVALNVLGVEKWRTSTVYGGDRVTTTPPAGGTATTSVSDGRGRTSALRQFHGSTPTGAYDETTYGYTPDGQPASITDPAGNAWRYGYDLRGRRTSADDPDSGHSTTAYDGADQTLSSTDGRGRTVTYDYDLLGRKTAAHQDSPTGPVLASWVFDTLAKGQATSSTRYVGGSAYTSAITGYDAGYRPTGGQTTIPASEGALAGTYATSMTYNVDGNVKSMSLPAAPGLAPETLNYHYDALGNPEWLDGNGAYVADTVYSRYGETTQLFLGNTLGKQSLQTFGYEEGTHRLIRSRTERENVTTPEADVAYTYDPAGNLIKAADSATQTDTQCFGYDYLRRLTQAWTPAADCAAAPATGSLAGPAPYWQSYTYDLTGNRTTETSHATGGDTTRTYAFPAAGGAHPHAVSRIDQTGPAGSRSDTFGYDAAGNTTGRNVAGKAQTLSWDAEGNLASVVDGTNTTAYVYDADGDRLIRRDPTGTTLYLDGTELHLDKTTGAVASTRYYTHNGQTVAVRTAAGVQFIASDPHGTGEVAITDKTGAVTRRLTAPFGGPRDTVAVTWPGEHGFVGGTIDSSTGLTHLGAREYDPAAGRFISADPILDPADPQQLNGYAYADNNPTTLSDPDGLEPGSFCNTSNCTVVNDCARSKGVAACGGVGASDYVNQAAASQKGQSSRRYADHELQIMNQVRHTLRSRPWDIGGAAAQAMDDVQNHYDYDCKNHGSQAACKPLNKQPESVEHGNGCGEVTDTASLICFQLTEELPTYLLMLLGIRGAAGEGAGAKPGEAAASNLPKLGAKPNFTNPAESPGRGWEWRGTGDPGSTKGSWYNPNSGESLHPDLGHPGPIGPHYDWKARNGTTYRVYPDGTVVPK